MKTKNYIEVLQKSYNLEEVLAIPFTWAKGDVEEIFEVTMTDQEWESLAETYSQDEGLCDTSFDTMNELVYLRFKAGR